MNKIPKQLSGFTITEMADGVVIQKDDTLHTLNTTAYEIFALVDGVRTVDDIIREMQDSYPDEDIEPVVLGFIDQLSTSGLIEVES